MSVLQKSLQQSGYCNRDKQEKLNALSGKEKISEIKPINFPYFKW